MDCKEEMFKEGQNNRKAIYYFIIQYMKEHGYSPSIREIMAGVKLSSTATVHNHIAHMLEEGLLETDHAGVPRAIRVTGFEYVRKEANERDKYTTEDKIHKIACHNGQETVQNLLIEESGELMKAIAKYRRYEGLEEQRKWLENIAEETMDLLMVCLENAYLIDEHAGIDVAKILEQKVDRTMKELGIE